MNSFQFTIRHDVPPGEERMHIRKIVACARKRFRGRYRGFTWQQEAETYRFAYEIPIDNELRAAIRKELAKGVRIGTRFSRVALWFTLPSAICVKGDIAIEPALILVTVRYSSFAGIIKRIFADVIGRILKAHSLANLYRLIEEAAWEHRIVALVTAR